MKRATGSLISTPPSEVPPLKQPPLMPEERAQDHQTLAEILLIEDTFKTNMRKNCQKSRQRNNILKR